MDSSRYRGGGEKDDGERFLHGGAPAGALARTLAETRGKNERCAGGIWWEWVPPQRAKNARWEPRWVAQTVSGLFEDNAEQAFLVEATEIGVERFGLGDDGLRRGQCMSEDIESPVGIDIVDDQSAVGTEGGPGQIELETHVARAVQTVVDEKINFS